MQNNNTSMATVVETFFVEETVNLIHDNEALAKWNEKVEELQLVGQTQVVKTDKSPIPFMWMNDALIATFETLCPTKVDVSKYDKTPIPLELLEMVGLCQKEQYFDVIKVWYNEKQKDPVLVGYSLSEGKDSDWQIEYYSKKYLIGRWADVKASIDSLVERAKKIFTHSQTIQLKQEIRDRQRKLEDLESIVDAKFGGTMPETDNIPF
jgi:hypothetical protein